MGRRTKRAVRTACCSGQVTETIGAQPQIVLMRTQTVLISEVVAGISGLRALRRSTNRIMWRTMSSFIGVEILLSHLPAKRSTSDNRPAADRCSEDRDR